MSVRGAETQQRQGATSWEYHPRSIPDPKAISREERREEPPPPPRWSGAAQRLRSPWRPSRGHTLLAVAVARIMILTCTTIRTLISLCTTWWHPHTLTVVIFNWTDRYHCGVPAALATARSRLTETTPRPCCGRRDAHAELDGLHLTPYSTHLTRDTALTCMK
jgi:hypothetical protein